MIPNLSNIYPFPLSPLDDSSLREKIFLVKLITKILKRKLVGLEIHLTLKGRDRSLKRGLAKTRKLRMIRTVLRNLIGEPKLMTKALEIPLRTIRPKKYQRIGQRKMILKRVQATLRKVTKKKNKKGKRRIRMTMRKTKLWN